MEKHSKEPLPLAPLQVNAEHVAFDLHSASQASAVFVLPTLGSVWYIKFTPCLRSKQNKQISQLAANYASKENLRQGLSTDRRQVRAVLEGRAV